MNSAETPPPPRPRRGIGRMVLVAAAGAGVVLGVQSFTSGSSHAGKTKPGQAQGSIASAGVGSTSRQGPAGTRGSVTATATSGSTGAKSASRSPAATPRGPVAGPRLVVVIDQPTGSFAQQNRLIRQGAAIALAQLNAAGGVGHHGVALVSEQLDGLAPAAVQQRLHAAGPGAVLILPCDTNSQSSLAAGAARYKTLMFAPCDGAASLARTLPTYWPVGMAGNEEAAGLANYMQRVGFLPVFVVTTPGSTYMTAMTAYLRAAAAAGHISVAGSAAISMAVTPADISRVVSAIKAAPRSGAVFSALPPPYFDRLAAGLKRAHVYQTLLGTSALDVPLTLAAGGADLENVTFPTYGFLRQTPAAAGFVSAYEARFGRLVGSFPGLGYETVRLLESAVTKAHSSAPTAIQRALSTGTKLSGAALFDRSYSGADHNPTSTVSVQKITARTFLPLVTTTPTNVPLP